MEKKKIFGIACLSVVGMFCVAIWFWYLYVLYMSPVKTPNYTYNIGKQSNAVTNELGEVVEDERSFMEINVYDNMFEVIINSTWDENKNAYMSYCFQFVSNSKLSVGAWPSSGQMQNAEAFWAMRSLKNVNIFGFNNIGSSFDKYANIKQVSVTQIGNEREENEQWRGLKKYRDIVRERNVFYSSEVFQNATLFTYSGLSNGTEILWTPDENVMERLNSKNGFMLVQIGTGEEKELFGISPRGTDVNTENHSGEHWIGSNRYSGDFKTKKSWYNPVYLDHQFKSLDMNYILSVIYNKVSTKQAGTDIDASIAFGDYFNYKINTGNNVYEDLMPSDSKYSKILKRVQTSINMHLKVNAGNATSSNNSLIGHYKGVENFGVTEENTFDYATSSNVYDLTENDFVIKNNTLVLSENFKNAFGDYVRKMRLRITIDMNKFSALGIKNLKINTGEFFVYKINGNEVNQKLSDYVLGGG